MAIPKFPPPVSQVWQGKDPVYKWVTLPKICQVIIDTPMYFYFSNQSVFQKHPNCFAVIFSNIKYF